MAIPDPAMTKPMPELSPAAALGGEFVLPAAPPLTRPVEARADAAVERLALRVGTVGLLCPADAGREVVSPPPTARIPHTPAWMLGLANVRGTLIPVVDLAQAFGVDRSPELRTYLLIAGGPDALGLLIDGLPVLQRFEAQERLDGVPPHPELLRGYVSHGYSRNGALWLDVDLDGFFDSLGDRIAV